MKIYILTIQSDGALAVLSAFRNKASAVKFFDEQIQLDVNKGYEIIDEYSQEDIDLIRHVELLKDDVESPSYDFELWEVDMI